MSRLWLANGGAGRQGPSWSKRTAVSASLFQTERFVQNSSRSSPPPPDDRHAIVNDCARRGAGISNSTALNHLGCSFPPQAS